MFFSKFLGGFKKCLHICSAYHLLIKLVDAGRRLALTLQAFFMSTWIVVLKILVFVYPRVCA